MTYALGKDCLLFIDNVRIFGVSDVLVREDTTEIDASGFREHVESTAVVQRTYTVSIVMPDIDKSIELCDKRWVNRKGFLLPYIYEIAMTGGLVHFTRYFTLHGIESDEPIDGLVIPRLTFKQWGGAVA